MGTRLYLIRGMLKGTLSDENKKLAMSNPAVMKAVEYEKNLKNIETVEKKKTKRGGK